LQVGNHGAAGSQMEIGGVTIESGRFVRKGSGCKCRACECKKQADE